jgi:hypothetical protein
VLYCGGGVDVEAGARDQAEAAEQLLRAFSQVGVGQVERGGDRQVLGVHEGQPVAGRGQVGGQVAESPSRVVPQLAGDHPNG